MKNNITLLPNDIELIEIGDDITIFFHTPTLQLYPLKDLDIKNFLFLYKNQAKEELEKHFSNKEISDIMHFIENKIRKAPKTIHNKSSVNQTQFDFREIILPISSQCNLSCPYCFAQTETGFNFNDFKEKDIDKIAEFLYLNVKTDENNPITIIFFGGEPLLNFPIMKYTASLFKNKYPTMHIAYSITTNGTLATEEMLDFLFENKVIMLVSLDGPDNEFNLRKYKDGSKSLNKVVQNVSKFRERGLYVQLRATFVSDNPYLYETYEFFEALNVPFAIVFAFTSHNKSHVEHTTYDTITLTRIKNDFDKVIDFYIDKFKAKDSINDVALQTFSKYIRFRFINASSCGGGKTYFTINANGDIFSCAHLINQSKHKIGTIYDMSHANLSVIPVGIEELTDCQDCWAKSLCLGGCVSQKIADGRMNIDTLGNNPCELEKLKWRFYIQLYYYAMKYNPELFMGTTNNNQTQPCD